MEIVIARKQRQRCHRSLCRLPPASEESDMESLFGQDTTWNARRVGLPDKRYIRLGNEVAARTCREI